MSDYLTRVRERQAVAYIEGLKQSGGDRLEEIPNDGEPGSEKFIEDVNSALSQYTPPDQYQRLNNVEEIRSFVSESII